ncbi:MAG: sugar transferase [Acidobacteria bacterium]|jgi:lipopolysaccharide/colanic/teichoic acid biosynthesis glycosyltransferase|nr:sugar transferase [Acidobacteriota bacterium]
MSKRLFQKESYYWLKVISDGIHLIAAFYIFYYLKRQTFFNGKFLALEPRFAKFFPLLLAAWFIVTLFSKKFTRLETVDYISLLKPYIVSIFGLAALTNIALYTFGWYDLSRVIVFGSIGLFFVFELIGLSIRFIFFTPGKEPGRNHSIPVVLFLGKFFLLIFSFTLIFYYKKHELAPPDEYLIFLMGVIFFGMVISLIVHRFEINFQKNYYRAVFPYIKSQAILIGLVGIAMFSANVMTFSRTIILGTLVLFAILENMAVSIYYLFTKKDDHYETRANFFSAPLLEKEQLEISNICAEIEKEKYGFPGSGFEYQFLKKKLKNTYLTKFEPVFTFVDKRVDLVKLDILNSIVTHSSNIFNIDILPENTLQFFANLRQLNDFRRINRYIIKINEKMKTGGIFLGKFESLSQTRNRLYRKFPFIFVRAIYPFFFLFKRAFPKLPVLQKIYFLLTRGRNRVLSTAEVLGRLYFCGFEIIDLKEIDDFTWFIVKKVKEPERDKKPSYDFFFKQKRVGQNGKPIYMYKIRTMHPYSEYIHKYALEHFELDEIGKIKNDFRITPWGRVFRRLWLDEIPMLINWLKGDIKLVGVRPLSQSFFDLYPGDFKQERIKYKPGLIPPYYVDMPASLEEVWASEQKYLEKYKKNPIKTDISYFFGALNNILFKHAKSE